MLISLLLSALVFAADTSTVLEAVQVFEGRERLEKTTGSQKVGAETVKSQKSTDVNKLLKQVPGVQVQEEDGMGLRPNIGLRGTHPHRSRKVVIMEDGVLIGPAPYSAPAAYYTPTMLHTQNLEVFKGLSSVPFGPNSIGGAINYLTKGYPEKTQARAEFSAGSYGSTILVGEAGTSKPQFSTILHGSKAATKGFKKLPSGADTGFSKNDVLLKAKARAFGPEGEVSIKAGYSDELSNETYLGLTAGDFRQDPFVRYGASARDNMKWKHTRAQLDYQLALGQGTLKTSLYRHDFHRNWERFNGFRERSIDINEVLRSPTGSLEPYYLVLNGREDSSSLGNAGDLSIVQNDRTFYSQGWQTELWQGFDTGEVNHGITVAARLHQDSILRNHLEDFYSVTSGALVRVTPTSIVTTNARDTAFAKTISLQDELKWKRWNAQIVSRFEDVDYKLRNNQSGVEKKRSTQGFAPGAGLGFKILPDWSVSSAVSRGLTLVGANASDEEGPERSVNYELSSLYLNDEHEMQVEVAGFYNDYQNIKGAASASEGSTISQVDEEYSGGKARIWGVEARAAKNLRWDKVSFPLRANLTWLDARFADTKESGNPEWGIGTIRPGDPLPYIPQWQASIGLGAQYKAVRQELVIQYNGRVFDQAIARGRSQVPGYGIVDWTSRFNFSKTGNIFARVDNILNKRYAVSWRPFGLRPGKPQGFMVGIEQVF